MKLITVFVRQKSELLDFCAKQVLRFEKCLVLDGFR